MTLHDPSPRHRIWYLLEIEREGAAPRSYHLENPAPRRQGVRLHQNYLDGLLLESPGRTELCPLWAAGADALAAAAASGRSYAPLCDGALFLRNPIPGHKTTRERVSDFLRDNVWQGEALVVFLRQNLFGDAWLRTAELEPGEARGEGAAPGAPSPAQVAPRAAGQAAQTADLGIAVESARQDHLDVGAWYPAAAAPGIWLSAYRASVVPEEILRSHPERVNPLDAVEAAALVYLVAFDTERYDFGFAMGTDHPRLDWSQRVLPNMVDRSLPGPDGIGALAPFVATGKVNPVDVGRTVATIAGGFKRDHGAFRYGELALRNHGSHYGFLEKGVLLSRLWPGLATFSVLESGNLRLETWSEADAALLPHLRHARQNGVPILERSPDGGPGTPGPLVNRWRPGNWSGSQDGSLRTLRSGFCLVEAPPRRHLIYGFFSSVTPSAMARVFQAYGCTYAMHLDMNALEHTYMALYHDGPSGRVVEHLVRGMEVLDLESGGQRVPRFVGYADNRDFFIVTRREDAQ